MTKAEQTAREIVKAWLIEDCHEKAHIADMMAGCMKCTSRIAATLQSQQDLLDKQEAEYKSTLAFLRKLVVSIEAVIISEKYGRVWEVYQLHEGAYSGPNFYTEFDAAKQFLKALARADELRKEKV